ncbi:MAG: right-handed parallel beta-helix repeat-containing protein [Acidobacteriota bacterium]|nr:right-handed parallel beta-helix repeat-containing protein [Acidobacteriota bacterium]
MFSGFHRFAPTILQMSRAAAVLAGAWLLAMLPATTAAAIEPSHPGASSDGVFQGLRGDGAGLGGAVLNVDTAMSFPTIQDAINAAVAGQTLEVTVPSLVEGQILVDRSLTLRGATGTEEVLMAVDTGSAGDARAWFLVETGVDLTVEGLTFDGNGFMVHQAFRHRGTGSFADCAFRDIQFNPSGPTYAGTAIVAFGGAVDVRRCSFETVGRVGILLFGAGVSGAVVEDSVFTGKGDGDFLDYGVEVGAGAVATVQRNRFTDARGVASSDGSRSAGMLVTTFFGPGTAATVEENDFEDNDRGLQVGFDGDTSAVTASFNRFFNNNFGMGSTAPGVLAENNWWCCNGGPLDMACDTFKGPEDPDFDPWLVLEVSADPPSAPGGTSSLITADLTMNSDGMDTSGLGHVPNDIPVLFSATLGIVNPSMVGTMDGIAEASFVAGPNPGPADVDATVDCETVTAAVEVLPGGVAIPALGPAGLALLALLIACAAVVLRRRRVAS